MEHNQLARGRVIYLAVGKEEEAVLQAEENRAPRGSRRLRCTAHASLSSRRGVFDLCHSMDLLGLLQLRQMPAHSDLPSSVQRPARRLLGVSVLYFCESQPTASEPELPRQERRVVFGGGSVLLAKRGRHSSRAISAGCAAGAATMGFGWLRIDFLRQLVLQQPRPRNSRL